jgi:hypothetical protein
LVGFIRRTWNRVDRTLWLSATRDHTELQIIHDSRPEVPFQIAQDLSREAKQLPLPDLIFDSHQQACAHHTHRLRMRRDLISYSMRPCSANHFFGGNSLARHFQPSDEPARTIHVGALFYHAGMTGSVAFAVRIRTEMPDFAFAPGRKHLVLRPFC